MYGIGRGCTFEHLLLFKGKARFIMNLDAIMVSDDSMTANNKDLSELMLITKPLFNLSLVPMTQTVGLSPQLRHGRGHYDHKRSPDCIKRH